MGVSLFEPLDVSGGTFAMSVVPLNLDEVSRNEPVTGSWLRRRRRRRWSGITYDGSHEIFTEDLA